MGILKKPSILLLVIPVITVLLVCSGCAPGTAVTLSAAEMQSLLEQVAKSDVFIEYKAQGKGGGGAGRPCCIG